MIQPKQPAIEHAKSSSHRYTSAQIKLIFTFCAYGVANLINYTAYSVVLRREDAYTQALDQYFTCESGGGENACDRSTFEELDPTEVTVPVFSVAYMLLPLAALIYVADISDMEKLYNKVRSCLRK